MKREDIEIRDQTHEMFVEGVTDEKPTENEILEMVAKEGYFVKDIDIFFDSMQGLWRFTGNLIELHA